MIMEVNPKYLSPTDSGAFQDLPKQDPVPGFDSECPTCKGHGMWNLRLNAYPREVTAARHFKQVCSTCFGVGYVTGEVCEHEWHAVRDVSRNLHVSQCGKCGLEFYRDSGD